MGRRRAPVRNGLQLTRCQGISTRVRSLLPCPSLSQGRSYAPAGALPLLELPPWERPHHFLGSMLAPQTWWRRSSPFLRPSQLPPRPPSDTPLQVAHRLHPKHIIFTSISSLYKIVFVKIVKMTGAQPPFKLCTGPTLQSTTPAWHRFPVPALNIALCSGKMSLQCPMGMQLHNREKHCEVRH